MEKTFTVTLTAMKHGLLEFVVLKTIEAEPMRPPVDAARLVN